MLNVSCMEMANVTITITLCHELREIKQYHYAKVHFCLVSDNIYPLLKLLKKDDLSINGIAKDSKKNIIYKRLKIFQKSDHSRWNYFYMSK